MQAAATEPDVLDTPDAGATAARGGLLRSAGYAAAILLSLVSAPLLIRHLGVGSHGEYGAYVTITAVAMIVAGTADLGVTAIGVREWAALSQDRRPELLSTLLGTRLALTLLGCGGAIAFGFAAGYDATRLAGIGVACGGVLALAAYDALAVPLQAELRQGWVAVAEFTRQLVQVALIVVLIVVGTGLVPLLAATIPAGLAALVLTGAISRQAIVRPAVHPRVWWGLLRGVLPFAVASALSVVYLRTTVIVASLVTSTTQINDFATAFRVMEVAIGIPVLMTGALFPVLARAAANDRERLAFAIRRVFEVALAGGALVAVCVAAAAPLVIEVLTGKGNAAAAIQALSVLGIGLGFSFVGACSQYSLLAIHAHRSILLVNAVALALNAGLTLLLAPAHGAVGAAIALAASEATVATLSTTLLLRSQRRLLPGAALIARIALATGIGAASALVLKGLGSVPEALGTLLVCGGGALAFKLVPHEIWSVGMLRRSRRPLRASGTDRRLT